MGIYIGATLDEIEGRGVLLEVPCWLCLPWHQEPMAAMDAATIRELGLAPCLPTRMTLFIPYVAWVELSNIFFGFPPPPIPEDPHPPI